MTANELRVLCEVLVRFRIVGDSDIIGIEEEQGFGVSRHGCGAVQDGIEKYGIILGLWERPDQCGSETRFDSGFHILLFVYPTSLYLWRISQSDRVPSGQYPRKLSKI